RIVEWTRGKRHSVGAFDRYPRPHLTGDDFMNLSAKILAIGGAVVLACAVSVPASAMPAAPKSAIVDQADSNIINIRNGGWNGGGRGWNGGGRGWNGARWRGGG